MTPQEVSAAHRVIREAFEEDVRTGDVSTLSTIPADSQSTARFLCKEIGVISGLQVVQMAFEYLDPLIHVEWTIREGQCVQAGTVIGTVKGPTRSLLTSERLALNLLQRMSGIASATAKFVQCIVQTGSKTRLLDTRKTAPGLRLLDKMAVRHGGGCNHRVGLYDMVMIKDNHIAAAGGIAAAVQQVRAYMKTHPELSVPIEVETRSLEEVHELLHVIENSHPGEARIQRVMFDNMVRVNRDIQGHVISVDTSLLKQAAHIVQQSQFGQGLESEASGNVTEETIGEIARTNVNFISVGAITHSVRALDISLKI